MLNFSLFRSTSDFGFTLEQEILLCCARTRLDNPTQARLCLLLKQEVNWDELFKLASQQGVLPLLYLSLKAIAPASVPPIALKELHLTFQKNVHRSLILTQELLRLIELFKIAEIPSIPFKGPILAASAYGKLSLRQMNDLDFLVHAADIDRAASLLEKEGYQLQVEVPWERHLVREKYDIDLHQIIAPKHLVASLSNDEVWQNVELFELNKVPVLSITPELTLLILCLHGTKECWRKLNRICDIAELLRHTPSLNWNQVLERSHRLGSKRLLLMGLQLAVELLDAPVPDAVQQQFKADSVLQALNHKVKQQLFVAVPDAVGEVERSTFHLQLRERWVDRADVFRGLMSHSGWFAPTENDKAVLPLPKWLSFLYYFLRVIRVFRKYGNNFLS